MTMRRGACALTILAVLSTEPVLSQDRQSTGGGGDPSSAADTSPVGFFGFTEGAGVAGAGDLSTAVNLEGFFGARDRDIWDASLFLTYGLTDRLQLTTFASLAHARAFDADADRHRREWGVSEIAASFKFAALDSGEDPIGLAFKVEPSLSFFEPGAAVHGIGYGGFFQILLDRQIVPGRVAVAANLNYGLGAFRRSGRDEDGARYDFEAGSDVGAAASLAFTPASGVTLALEAEYTRAYEGHFLDAYLGQAVFVGPALEVELRDGLVAYGMAGAQVWGRPAGGGDRLDIDNFERYRFEIGLSRSF